LRSASAGTLFHERCSFSVRDTGAGRLLENEGESSAHRAW
jgi:hypothetical protein